MHLQWLPNVAANALHVADCSIRFPDLFIDKTLRDDFFPVAQEIDTFIREQRDEPIPYLWPSLLQCALEVSSGQAIAERAFLKYFLADPSSSAGWVGSRIVELVAIFNRSFPKFLDQIDFRARPLQDLWLGHGSGLVFHIAKLTSPDLIPASVRVVPYQPVLNGYCESHILQNAIGVEAVLTNPIPELPEVLRILWGISQLNLELPEMSESIGYNRLRQLAPLAMLPPVLAAAQIMELARCTDEVAEIAIEHWHIPVPAEMDVHDQVVPKLMTWWETFLQSKPPMSIGMLALDRMLSD